MKNSRKSSINFWSTFSRTGKAEADPSRARPATACLRRFVRPAHRVTIMTSEIASALIPFLFSMVAVSFEERIKKGALPLSSINTMLVDYALPFALFLYTAKMQRASLAQHAVLIAVLVGVMLAPYFASLLVSRVVFKSDLAHAAVRAVTIGMPNFASVGLPLLRAVYGPESDLTVAIAVTAGAVVMSPAALILLERAR